ncbi:hypothetical protein HQ529_05870 [Candidatus Woesearchaeota archaeon]|nr:hypothetical protein [Candidatus Woesearchaeota archaeon]
MRNTIITITILVMIYLVTGIGLNCTITTPEACTNTSVLYLKNDSGGYRNAHAQNTSAATYPYVVCCNTTTGSNISTSCEDDDFLRLSNETNAHVQLTNYSSYDVVACMSASTGKITCTNSMDSCQADYECLASIASSENSNQTNAHVGDCDQYKRKICCNLNNRPNRPELISPEHNSSITNRTPTFVWNGTDPDNDTLTFNLYIECKPSCSVDNRQYLNINQTNYTIPIDLGYFWDDNYYYEWYVGAYDNISYSENSTTFNFTLQSAVILTLINSSIDFGNMSMGEKKNTTNESYYPFALRNDGNSFVDINISADDMIWDTQPAASRYFQYKVDNFTSELNSFNYSGSITNWTYIPISNNSIIDFLNYSDPTDTAEIDILIEVPLAESAGDKSGLLTLTGWYVSET